MKFFSIEELCRSTSASRLGIKNVPNEAERANLVALIENVLDPARDAYKRPIRVTSGFRCAELNSAVGGETNSQHKNGQAADIVSTKEGMQGSYLIGKLIERNGVFDQLIYENVGPNDMLPQWIHVSYRNDGKNRGEVRKKVKGANGYPLLRVIEQKNEKS